MTAMHLLGGVALVLFGVRFLRKGLDRLFGRGLIEWLQRMTVSRGKAFFAGIATGTCSPSSTALSLVTVHMMTSGSLTAERMLSVLLGSCVGLTVTVQLLALHVESYAGWLIFFGVLGFQFMRRESFRGIGQCLIALGLIFFAMQTIGEASRALAASADARTILHILEDHPTALLLLATMLTVVLQSSTASVGLALGLAGGNLLTPASLFVWVLGANLGVATTLLITGYPHLEARRLALAHLIVKLLAVGATMLALPAFVSWTAGLPLSVARLTADFHTGFNLVIGLAALPFIPWLARLARFLVTEPEPTHPQTSAEPETFLSEDALDTPSLALAHATREILRMADESQRMLAGFWQAHEKRDPALARQIQTHDDRVDQLYHVLKRYLSRISEDQLGERLGQWQVALLAFADEFEAIADIIERHLCAEVIKQVQEEVVFSPEDAAALASSYERLRERFALAAGLLSVHDAPSARTFVAGQDRLNEYYRQVQNEHHARLRRGDRAALAASASFLELLGGFRRINSHLGTLGYALGAGSRSRKARPALPAEPAAAPESPAEGQLRHQAH